MSFRVLAVVLVAALIGLAGCGDDDGGDDDPVGIANPAAEYCVAQGGESLIATEADGSQTGLCRLPDGTVVDEWEFFRQGTEGSTDEPTTPAEPGTDEPAEPDPADQPTAPAEPTAEPTAAPEPTTNPEGPVDYDVYLLVDGGECDEIVARPRTSTVEGVLGDAMTQLLAGPTDDEIAEGLGSWFSADTAGMLRAIEIDDGVARISFAADLRTTIPNASSSCGSAGLLAQLDATATQFSTVDRAIYSLDGDVDAFYEWLQLSAPE
jgi:putative hemolysin